MPKYVDFVGVLRSEGKNRSTDFLGIIGLIKGGK